MLLNTALIPATPVPYRRAMLSRLCLAFLYLTLLSACATRGPAVPPQGVPTASEPLDPAITPLTREQDDQIEQ